MTRGGFSIGSLFDIEIHIDWSWLFIFLLVTWSLASGLGQFHSDWSAALRWGTAIIAALLFFASVLAHEMAHSLMARAQGMSVRRITLFLFGGISNIQRHPPSPTAEFLIAIVGPITSIVLGVLFTLLSGATAGSISGAMTNPGELLSQLGPAASLLLWLGPINIALGVFNLIPGFPLDGGRVLRSILWGATDSLRQATRWASYAGQSVAWMLIISGIAMIFGTQIPFLGTGVMNGIWIAFIGWFLNNASQQSYRQIVIQDVLEDVPVSRVMRENVESVLPDISIRQFVDERLMEADDYSFPVRDGDSLIGVISLGDVRSLSRSDWPDVAVREVMTPAEELVTVQADEEAADALNKLVQRDVRQVPVLRGGTLVGMLSRRDLVRWLQLHSDAEVSGGSGQTVHALSG